METHLDVRGALRIILWCGIAGVLVDFDHLISLFIWRYINPSITEGRIWHTPLFILSCIGICYLGSRLGGLHTKLVLIGIIVVTALVLVFSPWVIWGITG